MTESGTTEQQTGKPDVHSFGERLYAARTRQGLSIEEVAKAVNLTVDMIEAIERSDVDKLPQPAFVQGYIRVYARQLGVSEDSVLEEYSRAVPHSLETVLRPRSVLPDEANSGSLVVKIVSIFLLVAIVLAAVYGIYSYYSEMADTLAPDTDDTASGTLEIPYQEYQQEQQYPEGEAEDKALAEVDEEFGSYNVEEVPLASMPETSVEPVLPVELVVTETAMSETEERTLGQDTERAAMIETRREAPGDDVLVLVADSSSWVEVVDANGVRLQYDLVQNGRTVTLRGSAPFNIFLGNAPAMTVRVNDVQVDMTKYIRSNNIAHFKVSVPDGRIVFH